MMETNNAYRRKEYGKGSTGYHAAFPLQKACLTQASDGHDGGAESPSTNRWKALAKRARAKAKRWQVHIHGYYLTLMRNHVALTTHHTFRYTRLVTFIIGVSRRVLFRKPALPYGAVNVSVHDRRDALFRRRAVYAISGNRLRIPILPGQSLGERRPGQP